MFKFNLSAEAQARLDAERHEVLRLYGLTNQWLAAALLRLARDARKGTTFRPDDPIYDAHLVWGLLPELARRLGSVRLEVPEIDWEARTASNYELRQRIGVTVANTRGSDSFAWRMLTREPVHGNPAAIGLDRLCPGTPGDKEDIISRELTGIARFRGVQYTGIWIPEVFMPEPGRPD